MLLSRITIRDRWLVSDVSRMISITSTFLLLLMLAWWLSLLLFSTTVWDILVWPSFKRWFPICLVCCLFIVSLVNNQVVSLFTLVHSNVWGPSCVVFVLGFQYFVTFIDNYSWCTWLYLMKNCSKLFSIFESFCAEVKTQFHIFVQVLHSDNGPEYFSTPFTTFMSS